MQNLRHSVRNIELGDERPPSFAMLEESFAETGRPTIERYSDTATCTTSEKPKKSATLKKNSKNLKSILR